jgi:serine/threonine-protein kinase
MAPPKVTKIGKYNVLDVIGRGGMGTVYKAVDPTIGRLVAIKTVTGAFSDDPLLLKRFYREAHSTGKLQHPNIVTVYDLGDQEGVPYLVMEYLEGESLEKMIKEGQPCPLAEKLSIIIQVCEGLGYAHQHEIIHRDVKPGNVVVLKDGGVKIVDFGIAQLGNERFTRTGQIIGSLYYLSPEQIQGADLDSRSDIYSTGVLLFEFLCGVLPFQGRDTPSTLAKILQAPPPSLADFLDPCPPELDRVLQRALSKNRHERYSSMEEFAYDLQSVQQDLIRDLIAGYLHRAEAFIEAENWEKGQEQIRQVLKFDKQHRRANELLREVQVQIQERQIGEQVRDLHSQAKDALAARQWEEALALLDQAIILDSANSELIEFRNAVKQSRTMLADALRRAELAHGKGDLDTAKRAVDEALRVDPSDTTAKALNTILSKEILERSKHKKIDDLVTEARKEIALRRFASALDLLRNAEGLDASSADVHKLIHTGTAGLEHQRRRRALEEACSEIEDLLNNDEYEAAYGKARDALRQFPEDPGLLKLRSFAEKQREAWTRRLFIEAQITTARQLVDSGEFIRAQGILNEALQRYSDDPGLVSFLAMVNDSIASQEAQHRIAEQQAHERRRYINLQVSAANELRRSGQTAHALEKLRDALRHYPDSELLRGQIEIVDDLLVRQEDQRKRIEEEARRKLEEVEQEIATARQFLNARQTSQAVVSLEQALRRCPESEKLKSELEFTQHRLAVEQAERQRTEEEARRQRAEIEHEIAKARQLLDSGQVIGAVTALEQVLSRYPDSEELKSQLRLAQQRLEIEEKTRQRQTEIEKEIALAGRLLDSNQTSRALAALDEALRRYPDSEKLKSQRELVRVSVAVDLERQKAAEQKAQRRQESIKGVLTDVRYLLNAKQAGRAVAALEQGLRRFPDSEELKTQLESARERLSGEQSEREQAEREARFEQEEIQREIAASRKHLDSRQTSQAVESLEKAVRKFPLSKELNAQLDLARQRLAREQDEQVRVEEEAARKKREIENQISAARRLLDLNRTDDAVDAAERAVRNFPENGELRSLLATAKQLQEQQRAEREKAASQAKARRKDIASAVDSAKQLLKTKQSSKACELLEKAVQRYPESQELRTQLEASKEKLAREHAEEEESEKYRVRLEGATSSARTLLDRDRPDEAVKALEASLRGLGKEPQLQVLLETAKAAAKQKKAEERRRAEELRRSEEQRRTRERDLAELKGLANSVSVDVKPAVLEKWVRRAQELSKAYPAEPEFQENLKIIKQALESANAIETEQDVRQARTGLATEMLAPGGAARVPSGLVEEPTIPLPQVSPELGPSRNPPGFLGKWVIAAAIGLVVVLAFISVRLVSSPKTYTVYIDTQPAGAQVQVGNQTCITPNCRPNLPAGTYQLRAELQGYEPRLQGLMVDPHQAQQVVSVVLTPLPPPSPTKASYLVVRTGVDGAVVLINGKKPDQLTSGGALRLPLDPGSYRVEVEKSGYLPIKPAIARVRKDAETVIDFHLTLSPTYAALMINGARPNVQVLVDGHYLGLIGNDGKFAHDLSPGRHEIVLSQDGRNSNAIASNFVAGEPSNIDGKRFSFPEPPSLPSVVVLRNLPPGALIRVDGRDVHPADNSGVAQFEVTASNHTLELTKEGFKTRNIQRSFNSGQTILDGSMEQSLEMLEAQDWKQANTTNDPKQVEEYLAKHPSSPHAAEAESRLDDLTWERTNRTDVAALKAYISRFRNAHHSEDASHLIDDLLWKQVDKHDPKAVRAFVGNYPTSAHRDEAEGIVKQLDLLDADKKGIQDAINAFNAAFQHQSARELKAIWPSVPPLFLDAMDRPGGITTIMTLAPTGVPVISGDTAVIMCDLNSTTTPSGRPARSPLRERVQLHKRNGRWQIEQMSKQ